MRSFNDEHPEIFSPDTQGIGANSFEYALNDRETYKTPFFSIYHKQLEQPLTDTFGENCERLGDCLKRHNPDQLSDIGIYKALEEMVTGLDKKPIMLTIIINKKLWVVQRGDSKAVLNDGGDPIQLTQRELDSPNPQLRITAYPLSNLKPNSHLIMASGDIWDVASTRQVAQTVHDCDSQKYTESYTAKLIASAVYNADAAKDLAILIVKLS